MTRGWLLALALTTAWGFSGKRTAEAPPVTLRIYYSANREGEIEPCGCQVHQWGGLDRWSALLSRDDVLNEVTLKVEAGDSFFSLPEMDPGRLEREKLRAKVMAKAFRRVGLNAFTPGERDLAAGVPFLKELEIESGAVFLAANLGYREGKAPFASHFLIERNELRIGLIGVVGQKALRVTSMKVTDPAAAVRRSLSDLRKDDPHVIVVLSHAGLEEDRALAKIDGVDLIVGSHSQDALEQPERFGKAAIVQSPNQGQQAGRIRLQFPAREWIEHKWLPVDGTAGADATVTAWIAEYKEAVRQLALKQSEPAAPATPDRPFVANPNFCKNCHRKQYDFWAETKHSSAILVLQSKNQLFDPDCVGCHTLGYGAAGGFAKITQPIVVEREGKKGGPFVERMLKAVFAVDPGKGPLDSRQEPARHKALRLSYHKAIADLADSGKLQRNYLGVQCEHCHGNRQGHPAENSQTVKRVSEATCKGCHTPPHAAPYDPKNFSKAACPLSSRS